MKCVLVMFVIGIFCRGILAEDSFIILANHNQNITQNLKLKVIKIMENGIAKNASTNEIQTSFVKAKEDALMEFNATKIGGADEIGRYYDELKRALDALNGQFFKSLTWFNRAIAHYKNYITIFMITNAPRTAHEITKNRTIAEFERKAYIYGNELYDAFKNKLDKELDFQFQWTFPGIDTNKIVGGNNNNTATLGHTTITNNSTEATTTEVNETKDN